MDSLFEIIFAVIVIIVSALWNRDKGTADTSSGGAGDSDLAAIEDFFKKQSKGGGELQQSGSSERNMAGQSVFEGNQSTTASTTGKRRKDRKKAKNAPHPFVDASNSQTGGWDDSPCLDQAPTLEGTSYELSAPKIRHDSRRDPQIARRTSKLKFGKDDILKAFIFSEVLNRYDLNKIFARIPDKRKE